MLTKRGSPKPSQHLRSYGLNKTIDLTCVRMDGMTDGRTDKRMDPSGTFSKKNAFLAVFIAHIFDVLYKIYNA